jgi:glutamyl-tRNA reductase
MVLGETQIVGQLKDAFRFSYDNNFCAKKIARAMKAAFKTAAKVRNATDISSKPVSMASVAVSKLKSLISDVSGKKALVIGVGEMSEITAKHLLAAGVDVYIMNRTLHKADALARECGAKVLEFSQLKNALNEFEILFTATSAHQPIISSDFIEAKEFDRYWFDLALPRDISYDKGERIHLYIIDDLKLIVDENITSRENAARSAHTIIGRSVVEFFESLNTQNIESLIKEIYTRANKAARDETQRALKCGYIPKEYEMQAQKMCEQALKRFLHELTENMRNASEETQANLLREAISSTMKTRDEK